MQATITYTQCPVCDSGDIHSFSQVKDFSVSGNIFAVWKCNSCSGMFTQYAPSQQVIGKYYENENYISHTENAKGLVNSLYLKARKITLRSKLSLIKKYTRKNTGKLLDYGAGTGAFAAFVKSMGWQSEGIEPSEAARNTALKNNKIVLLEPEKLSSLENRSYDVITLWHVLEHIHDLKSTFQNIISKLKPEGKIFIAVPNFTSYDAAFYQEYWAAYDVPRHLYHFSPQSMKKLAELSGLEIVELKPMWYDSFYVSILSEQYKTGRKNLVTAFVNGCFSNLKAIFIPGKCSSVIYICKLKKNIGQ